MVMCRLCLKETDHLQNILQSQLKCAEWTLKESIYCIFDVKVDINDPYTKIICERCESAIKCIGKYRELYKNNQLVLELSLKSKNQELTSQATTQLTCATTTQAPPLAVSSPKAKKRRLTFIDYYYKTPTMAIRALVNEKIVDGHKKEENAKNEEPLVRMQEFEVQVCRYCSKTFGTKHQLETHCNSEHGPLHSKNKLLSVGRLKKHAKGKRKNQQPETILSQIKDPGRVSKLKYREAVPFAKLNFPKELGPGENNPDIGDGKDNASETTGFAEGADGTLETEIKTINVKGLLGHKEDIVKILNKRHPWLNLKDFSIPVNRYISPTSEIDRTEADQKSNPLDKSSHASVSTGIQNWKGNLSETLRTLSLISKSEMMKQWMNISKVTEENKETDSENDDGGGFEGITAIEESPEEQDPSKPGPDTQHAIEDQETEDPEEIVPKTQQKEKTDEVVRKDSSRTSQESKKIQEAEAEDSTKTLSKQSKVVKESQVHETEEKQKEVVSKSDVGSPFSKMTEMQNMKEHILSTLRKIKEIKEKTAMNQRGRILQAQDTEKEQSNSDNTIAEAENTMEDTPAVSVQDNGDKSENAQETTDESEEEATENTWQDDRDFGETEVASNVDETETTAEEIVYVTADDICMSESEQITSKQSSECGPVAIKQEQQDQTSVPEHPPTANANERIEWTKNISASLMKLQQLKTIELVGKSTDSQQLGSKEDTLNNLGELILPDNNLDEDSEHSVGAEENFEIHEDNREEDTDEGTSDADVLDTVSINEQLTPVNGKELLVSIERCPAELHQNPKTSQVNQHTSLGKSSQTATVKKRKNIVTQNESVKQKMETAKVVAMSGNKFPENEDMMEDSDSDNETVAHFISRHSKSHLDGNRSKAGTIDSKTGTKTITVNQNCLLADEQTIRKTLNNQHGWLNLKEFEISVTSCEVPSEVRQSIITERNKWRESISALLPKMKELKENDIVKEKTEVVKARVNMEKSADVDPHGLPTEKQNILGSGAETLDTDDRTREPEFIGIGTNEREGAEIATTKLTTEGDNGDPLSDTVVFYASSDEDAENNGHELIVTVSLSNSSEIPNSIKQQLQLKDFHIPLERLHIPTKSKDDFGLNGWKKHLSKIVLKLQSIKKLASEEEKSNISDVKPIAKQSKKIVKLNYNFVRKLSKKLKNDAPTTDDMYELVVDPNSLEFVTQIINVNNQSRNEREQTDSAITVLQDIITQVGPHVAEEIPSFTEDIMQRQIVASDDMEKNLPVTDCIIETIDISPQDSSEIEVSRADQELCPTPVANLEDECENQKLGDILEQASIWIQENAEDTDGSIQGRKISLVQIEDLIQNQENKVLSNQDSQVPTEKVVHETYADLVASLEIEGVSTQQTTETIKQGEEMNTLVTEDVAQYEDIDTFISENEIDNDLDHRTYEALLKSSETETENQTHIEQTYPVQQPTEDISQDKGTDKRQKTRNISPLQTENERQEAENPEKETKNKKQPSEPQIYSPKIKHSTTSKPADPKKTGYKSNIKKKAKKEKSKVSTCCLHNRPNFNLKDDERVPSTSLVMDHNPVQNSDSDENKAHCSKSDAKPSKQRKKTPNITLMNETDRLTRDVEQLSKYLNVLKLMEDNQKSLSSSSGKLPSSAHCDDTVKKASTQQQEVQEKLKNTNKEEDLAKGRTTGSAEQNSSSPKTNQTNTLTLKEHGRKENNTNTVVHEKRADEIKIWRAHLNSTLSKIKQIQASKLFNSKMNAATKLLCKEDEKDDVTKT